MEERAFKTLRKEAAKLRDEVELEEQQERELEIESLQVMWGITLQTRGGGGGGDWRPVHTALLSIIWAMMLKAGLSYKVGWSAVSCV